ncbi:uncharacterized protein N7482_007363 [Penicillium canariense]|uniref:Uncharacterized protein n=1 Tax=Penicillium canariense TaxID=189055 RepID=A0A9W9HY16_9EURO|nr:uncharacterized protein N7482_007363 [Penicillium canariense]KAJ5160359.1 hypothetical protein N7482_007363 [Penicillium canariense]
MPPFRNLLGRKPQPNGADVAVLDETRLSPNQRPGPAPISMRRSCDGQQPPEYKLSVVNDSGVYLPPSPPEKQSFWHRYPGSSRSANHRDLVDENEPFSISRESFDSYRRSFDISARSPVLHSEAAPSRTSLDSRFSRINSVRSTSFERPERMEEENFEDVGLNDDSKPKKKGLFARFGDSSNDTQQSANKSSTSFGFHIPGRKHGQSGGGSELGTVKTPTAVVAPAAENSE